jgi:hypothetical protein
LAENVFCIFQCLVGGKLMQVNENVLHRQKKKKRKKEKEAKYSRKSFLFFKSGKCFGKRNILNIPQKISLKKIPILVLSLKFSLRF